MTSKAKRKQGSVLATIRSPEKDPYMKESSKSYRKCQQTHTMESLHLAKQRKDIETEEKMVREKFRQESREVHADLYRLRQAKVKADMQRNVQSAGKSRQRNESPQSGDGSNLGTISEATDPYPIKIGKSNKENKKKRATPRRERRPSAEFEDLDFHFASGQGRPYRSILPALSPVNSPRVARKADHPSPTPQKCYWVGEPEAISSVRRAKKSVQEQQKNVILTRSINEAYRSKASSPAGHRDSLTPSDERRFFSGQPEAGMPQRMMVRDQIPSRDRSYGRRRSLSNPEPIDLRRLSAASDRSLHIRP